MHPAGPAFLAIAFAVVIWGGVKLGRIKLGGISLGVTFVLFVGILFGHIYNVYIVKPELASNPEFSGSIAAMDQIINFAKELGLILFVYCIGLQVGPGFFATFKKGFVFTI